MDKMLKAVRLRREDIFKDVKGMYEQDILTYNFTEDDLKDYTIAHLNITSMFQALEVSREEIKYRLGEEFEKWYFVTHPEIINNFWNKQL